MVKACCVALMALVMAGCVRGRLEREPQNRSYTYSQNLPKNIFKEMVIGDTLKFTLEENGTTGYTWTLTPEIKGMKSQLVHQAADSKLCGAPGKAIATFAAQKPGEYVYVLKYQRPWESVPIEKMVITLKVF